jgi:hypothetical protein
MSRTLNMDRERPKKRGYSPESELRSGFRLAAAWCCVSEVVHCQYGARSVYSAVHGYL